MGTERAMFLFFFRNFFVSPHRQPLGKKTSFFLNRNIDNIVHAINLEIASLAHLFKLAGDKGRDHPEIFASSTLCNISYNST
jgi:hypothetical protein